MALTADEKQLLAELTRKAEEPDDDYEVYLVNDSGHQVRMPVSRAEKWLRQQGFLFDDDEEEAEAEGAPEEEEEGTTTAPVTKPARRTAYFKK